LKDLEPLIPGFYVDSNARIHVNMREFLAAHGLPDSLEIRAIVWMEIGEVFDNMEIIEIPPDMPSN
jgi:hypothetical protein